MEKHSRFFFYFFLFNDILFSSLFVYTLDSMPKVKPRIPSASLSQTVTVDETVMAAASQNITAYAANTEQSQRYKQALMDPCPQLNVSIFQHFSFSLCQDGGL